MPIPPPTQDLESRLRRWADLLDAAVVEIQTTITEIRSDDELTGNPKGGDDDA